ncbi:hypothetical protein HCU73_18450 [Roseibacterium sp. KMU-115]|uniref:Uncharacterized protein n=1 Tax=Roseicyclus persicicus TaxID=2650661 RepID=A0A7X6K161_9RHOB|nr:hypothetical protein [Roseibacterium persicicum]
MLFEDMQTLRASSEGACFIGAYGERVALAAIKAVNVPNTELPDPFHGEELRANLFINR